MINLQKDETKLEGKWLLVDGKMIGDAVTDRIEKLISSSLSKVATSQDGWDVLYLDKNDGRYWELTYPESYMHGGGPPTLTCISVEDARKKYEIS